MLPYTTAAPSPIDDCRALVPVSPVSPISGEYRSDKENRVYLYGRFTIEGQSMTFDIRCRDGTVYKIDFSTRNQVQMIELVPSICQLDQIEYGPVAGAARLVSYAAERDPRPGRRLLRGDYRASGTYDVAFRKFLQQ